MRLLRAAFAAFVSLWWSPPAPADEPFEPVKSPAWLASATRMIYCMPSELELVERSGARVVHTNVFWPYYPLRRDGGGPKPEDARALHDLVAACKARGARVCLGLPPFMPAGLVEEHPDWRVHPADDGAILRVEPKEDDLGTRLGCNLGPWGDWFIDQLVEIVEEYGVAGYSFDGNYHPPVCYCPACKAAYREERGRDLPAAVDLNRVEYREYLVWRGEKLEDHYRRMQRRLKAANPEAVIISWTTNGGRYGHWLTSPRVMPTRLNLLFDMPMQEWWLDETNFGASVAPAFGAAYLRGIMGSDRPAASEPYLMARGNPYGPDSFPAHERKARALLALTHGNIAPQATWLPDGGTSMAATFEELERREPWTVGARPLPWIALHVGEQTRQFFAHADIAERFLPHVFGAFRLAMEEHLPATLVNDWDLSDEGLKPYRVLILPNSAALSDEQAAAVRRFVEAGGGLVATGEASLCDEIGRPRDDFALKDLFGVSYRGRPAAAGARPEVDANFAIALDAAYWAERTGVARLTWAEAPIWADAELDALVPRRSSQFKGPLIAVAEPAEPSEVVARYLPEGSTGPDHPAAVARRFGEGRVVYLAAGLDAALWSYAYPYQRRLLARAVEFAAGDARPPVAVEAPKCVQATFTEQAGRTVVHLFNDLNTTGGHGLPRNEVPLREEVVPVPGIRLTVRGPAPGRVHVEPGGPDLEARREGDALVFDVPPLDRHALVVIEPAD